MRNILKNEKKIREISPFSSKTCGVEIIKNSTTHGDNTHITRFQNIENNLREKHRRFKKNGRSQNENEWHKLVG